MNGPGDGTTAAVLAVAAIRSWIASHVGERVTIEVGSYDEDVDLSGACPIVLVTQLGPLEADSWRARISVGLPELPASELQIDPGRILCADVVDDGRSLRIYNNDATTIRITA